MVLLIAHWIDDEWCIMRLTQSQQDRLIETLPQENRQQQKHFCFGRPSPIVFWWNRFTQQCKHIYLF